MVPRGAYVTTRAVVWSVAWERRTFISASPSRVAIAVGAQRAGGRGLLQ